MNKKAIYISLGLLFSAFVWQACENLPHEQFNKFVLMTRNDFTDREIVYDPSGVVTTKVSVSINGTSKIGKDVPVEIEYYPDTLRDYNFEKFRYDSASYYQVFEDFEIPNPKTTILKGNEYAEIPINIKVAQMDKFKDFVLPIRVKSAEGYPVAPDYSRVMLMHIILKNDISGKYTTNATINGAFNSLNRTLNVIDENTCYTFTGDVEEKGDNADYRLYVSVSADSVVSLSAPNPDLQLQVAAPDPEMMVNVSKIINNEFRIYINYSYLDLKNNERKEYKGYLSRIISTK